MDTRKANILAVDDTHANLRLLTRILTGHKYTVRPVPDGLLALSAVYAETPDLILLDIMMPGMTGYEVCEKLKADERTRDIPVIFISAKNEIFDKVKAFSLGGVDYITKPFQSEEVLARVETHLSLRSLQTTLEEKNKALTEAYEQLKSAQNQLILREKMAALGQLVAGVAHEINTPLGAIRASINNISNALSASVRQLPQLFQELPPDRQADFFALSQAALENRKNLSSRETRKLRRSLKKELEEQGMNETDSFANILANMGISHISPFIRLLEEENSSFILQTAYNLFVQQNNSRNIMTAVERASKVVFALKSYARHDDSDQMLSANVPEGIDVVLTLYDNQLKKGIEVIKNYGEVPDMLCYPDELNQVWTNLIHNAIQAMEGKGILEITVRIPDASELPDIRSDSETEPGQDAYVIVQITDSGCGISEEAQARIFEPFFTTKPSGEGSGLGLDIVQNIIDRHQGRIKVESQPGKTTFSVFLPISVSG
ncbi:response regulator [Desulfobacterales bacterium HSG2]|nr:response regulator [Desulfobacterales bacterium HSG2]